MMMAWTCLGMGTSRHPPDSSSRSRSFIFVFSLQRKKALVFSLQRKSALEQAAASSRQARSVTSLCAVHSERRGPRHSRPWAAEPSCSTCRIEVPAMSRGPRELQFTWQLHYTHAQPGRTSQLYRVGQVPEDVGLARWAQPRLCGAQSMETVRHLSIQPHRAVVPEIACNISASS